MSPFQQAITDSEAFNFDSGDIARIRGEFRTLISRLSNMYKAWKVASHVPAKHSACRRLLEDFHTTDNADDEKSANDANENPIWDHLRELGRISFEGAGKKESSTCSLRNGDAADSLSPTPTVDRRPPTGGRSEGAVPSPVIEGRFGISPSTHSAFQGGDGSVTHSSANDANENPIWDHIHELGRISFAGAGKKESSTSSLRNGEATDSLSPTPTVDRRPLTGGRSEGALPGSVIEGRLGNAPSTNSAFQGGDGSVTLSSANDEDENPIWDHLRQRELERISFEVASKKESSTSSLQIRDAADSLSPTPMVDRRPPTGGRSEGAVPSPVIEGRFGISPSTHSSFQAVISPEAFRRRRKRTARKSVLPSNGLEMYTSSVQIGDAADALSPRPTVDSRPPTGGRSEGAVPGPVIEGRHGISPSTHSAFQGVISPGIDHYGAVRRRKQRTARKSVLPNNGLEMYTSHGDEGTILSSSKTKYDSDDSWRQESDGSESDREEVVSTNSSEAVLRHDDEQDEHWDVDGAIQFPFPLTETYEGEHLEIDLLRVVKCSYDVDSIYLMGDCPSQVLRAMGSDGTCQFNSSINRTNTTNTSRIAADYHGTVNLRPRLVGQRLRRLKVIALHKFPNIGLCNVFKNNICYTFSLFLLEAPLISERNYIKHEMLLTVIAALNIAIDGHFPYDSHDGYGRGIDSVDDQEWSSLNYFELQDGSKAQKKKIHGSQKQLSVGASAMFFHRYERALELMANNPELIDSANQLRDSYYWQKRQGIRPEESGAVDVAQLKVNAALRYQSIPDYWP